MVGEQCNGKSYDNVKLCPIMIDEAYDDKNSSLLHYLVHVS